MNMQQQCGTKHNKRTKTDSNAPIVLIKGVGVWHNIHCPKDCLNAREAHFALLAHSLPTNV
jgi:hypothetical protein